jgi:hypothetical protein
MRKAYIIDIPGSEKSITVTETTDQRRLVLKVGHEKTVLSYQPWSELMDLHYKASIRQEETDYERFDIRPAHPSDPAGEGASVSSAHLDWQDHEGDGGDTDKGA